MNIEFKKEIEAILGIPKGSAVLLRNYLLNVHAKVVGRRKARLSVIGSSPNARVCVFGKPGPYAYDGRKNTFRSFCKTNNLASSDCWSNLFTCDYTILHYLRDDKSLPKQIVSILCSIVGIQNLYFVEPSFISSVLGYTRKIECPLQFSEINSYLIDDMGFYFDSIAGSRIEQFLNSANFNLAEIERKNCAILIQEIVERRLTKYSFQAKLSPSYFYREEARVLVVDQTIADASVWRAQGDSIIFKNMLSDALSENPDAVIYIKTHPDMHLSARNCYYKNLSLPEIEMERIRIIDFPVNPYDILKKMDTIYVCTSQLGFEALMAGKRVKTYGMPIYAGWGLTEDVQRCKRRLRQRTLEEVFFAIYIKFSIHLSSCKKYFIDLEDQIKKMSTLTEQYEVYKNSLKFK